MKSVLFSPLLFAAAALAERWIVQLKPASDGSPSSFRDRHPNTDISRIYTIGSFKGFVVSTDDIS